MHTCRHVRTYACMHAHILEWMTHTCVNICAYMYVHTSMCAYMHVHACEGLSAYSLMSLYMCTCLNFLLIHACICSCACMYVWIPACVHAIALQPCTPAWGYGGAVCIPHATILKPCTHVHIHVCMHAYAILDLWICICMYECQHSQLAFVSVLSAPVFVVYVCDFLCFYFLEFGYLVEFVCVHNVF